MKLSAIILSAAILLSCSQPVTSEAPETAPAEPEQEQATEPVTVAEPEQDLFFGGVFNYV